jgi:hypothetical protein
LKEINKLKELFPDYQIFGLVSTLLKNAIIKSRPLDTGERRDHASMILEIKQLL